MVDTEEWFELHEYQGHEMNQRGEIRNKRNKKKLAATSKNQNGARFVTIRNTVEGRMQNKALGVLVAETFCPGKGEITLWGGVNDTVVFLDGDRDNVSPTNLMWAPRWYAITYHEQVGNPIWNEKKRIVENNGPIYRSYAHAAQHTGLLPNAIAHAVRYNDNLSADTHENLVHRVVTGHVFRSI